MKPSVNFSKLLYTRDGLLVTSANRMATIFRMNPEYMVDMLHAYFSIHSQSGDMGKSGDFEVVETDEALELTLAAFEAVMYKPSRSLYWRGTYSRIIKEFQREHARRERLGLPSKLYVESN